MTGPGELVVAADRLAIPLHRLATALERALDYAETDTPRGLCPIDGPHIGPTDKPPTFCRFHAGHTGDHESTDGARWRYTDQENRP